jgi:hypothetical protein
MHRDLKLIGGKFLDEMLPKEKQYLYKYFKKPTQKVFIKYFLEFGRYQYVVQHTGIYYSRYWAKRMSHRLQVLVKAYDQAREEGDFDTIAKITSGKWKPPGGFPKI